MTVLLCRETLDEWDPMKFDYGLKEFNSYGDGPGHRLETRDVKEIVTLFVDNIPVLINKVGRSSYVNSNHPPVLFSLVWKS